jgi:hypothetical protein
MIKLPERNDNLKEYAGRLVLAVMCVTEGMCRRSQSLELSPAEQYANKERRLPGGRAHPSIDWAAKIQYTLYWKLEAVSVKSPAG